MELVGLCHNEDYQRTCMSTFACPKCSVIIMLHSCLCVGAQIIDIMLLVVDATKGIQTQTAEVCYIYWCSGLVLCAGRNDRSCCLLQCLVIGEITCSRLIVVINKVDLLPEASRPSQVAKVMSVVFHCLSLRVILFSVCWMC